MRQLIVNPEQVEHPSDAVVDDVIKGLGPDVERGHWRGNDGADLRQVRQHSQVARVQG